MTFHKKEPVTTCGIYLYHTKLKKILVCHATHSSWKRWTIPKGIAEPHEKVYDAAKENCLRKQDLI